MVNCAAFAVTMKNRFTTLDLVCELRELRRRLVGMRVNQVYDVDSRTYLLRLHKSLGAAGSVKKEEEEGTKAVLLIESGARIHATQFEWPKVILLERKDFIPVYLMTFLFLFQSPAPSGFAMKLRKHLNNKRLESAEQLGADRVVDLRFGTGDAAHHLILELYDRGNLVLTDCEYKILNILRPRVQGEDKFLVRETYPVELAREHNPDMTQERLEEIFAKARPNDTVKKLCAPHFEYGPPFLEHLLLREGVKPNAKAGKDFDLSQDGNADKVLKAFNGAKDFLDSNAPGGFVVQKRETRPAAPGEGEGDVEYLSYAEFHPYLLEQHRDRPVLDLVTFDAAVDEFFSKVESQKIESRAVQQERAALKKLDNVRKDHEERLGRLRSEQASDRRRAELIELNEALVDAALTVMRSAIANQVDWKEIGLLVKEAADGGDPVASRITGLKLDTNHFSMLLTDPYSHLNQGDDDDDSDEEESDKEPNELEVDIDLDLSAQANARKYYSHKKAAGAKEQKTLDSHSVAMKSAEKKTKQTLKEVAAMTSINKARKVFWFEKFFWFISSENYLVVAGRDAQQNELLVKRYLRPGDVYVHADLHGASSVVVKNPQGPEHPVPPKTLNEAGQMAVCYSAAWDSKVVTSAWWVEAAQVSKTAPSGEYLTVGSFMIRGKKNFLPPATLVLGFGFLFRLEEGSIERHRGERKVRDANDDALSVATTADTAADSLADELAEVEIALDDGGDSSGEEEDKKEEREEALEEIKEEGEAEEKKEEGDACSGDGDEQKDVPEVEEKDSDDEPSSAFPDTAIEIDYTKRGEAKVLARGMSESSDRNSVAKDQEEVDVIRFVQRPKKGKQQQQQKASAKNKVKNVKEEEDSDDGKGNNKGQQQQNKRGKKGKMKKIKEKYKDQDEEERELRMQILQGSQKEGGKKNKGNKDKKKEDQGGGNKKGQQQGQKPKQQRPQQQQQKKEEELHIDEEEEEEDREAAAKSETDMLDSLTGIPVQEDELLFSVPVVAPYNVMNAYRYKVKLTPGTGKRGKATKTALSMFLGDRAAAQREKDLLRAVKDQDLARNLPGKVKLSAPHLQKAKQKAKGKGKK